jgi:hypothetical protein
MRHHSLLAPRPRASAGPGPSRRPDDRHEREAERVAQDADRLVSGEDPVRRFGARFGHDFSRVRIYADQRAGHAAAALGARAYTIGDGVAIAPRHFDRRTLAHELTHVVAQRGGGRSADGRVISPAPRGAVQCQLVTPHAPGGGWGGVMERDRQRVQRRMRELHFYHGSSWEIARTIPGNVDPARGGGDFSRGFYTHHDRDNDKARNRARTWGMAIARDRGEPYAGVIDFTVQRADYDAVRAGGRSHDFGLTSLDQPDYRRRQREWLDFVTSHGREAQPTYDPSSMAWRHERRATQPNLGYNVVSGPFYRGIRGLPGAPPGRDDFHPYAEGRTLPQQVVWDNDGARLLNSGRVRTRLEQYDARTGNRIDPPRQTPPGAAAQTPNPAVHPGVIPIGPQLRP